MSHVSHEKTETGHHHSFLHHHSHSDSGPAPFPALSGKPTVRFFCKAEPNFSLTIRNGKVVLAPSDPSDQFQVCIYFLFCLPVYSCCAALSNLLDLGSVASFLKKVKDFFFPRNIEYCR